jgi:murein DD-endopeptidase MepM/ murein hydrolase activator NlpD
MPIGTDLFAPVDCVVLALNEGVPNNRPGTNPGSGAPSNWVLLGYTWKGNPYSYLFNHLSPAIPVAKGQRVTKGIKIGDSGNSGNSTGPHTHITLQPGYQTAATRYEYLTKRDGVVPPSAGWQWPYVDLSAVTYAATRDADSYRTGTLLVQQALRDQVGLDYSSGPGIFGPKTKAAYALWEAKIGATRNGIPDMTTLTRLGKAAGMFYVTP